MEKQRPIRESEVHSQFLSPFDSLQIIALVRLADCDFPQSKIHTNNGALRKLKNFQTKKKILQIFFYVWVEKIFPDFISICSCGQGNFDFASRVYIPGFF